MHPTQDLQRHVGKFYGKYAGEVTDVADPDKTGCITVTVPSVFGKDVPVAARPCFAPGHFWVPPVGARVWVEFEAGNPQYPLWVGTWYPVGSNPPESQLDPPEARVAHTPSGHTVELVDTEGEEKVLIRHMAGAFVSIDPDGSVLVASKEGSHLFLNAADGVVSLMGQHGDLLTMSDKGVVLVNKDGTTLELKEKKVKVIAADVVQVEAKDVMVNSSSVTLGKDAMEPALLGNMFKTLWMMVTTHVHPTAMGPSGPPLPPLSTAQLDLALSKAVKVK